MTIIILRHLITHFIIGDFPAYYTSSAAVYNRKPELSVDEIKRQSNLLDHLFSKGYINEKVNCNSGIDTTIFKTSASIILFLKKHYSIKHEYSANT